MFVVHMFIQLVSRGTRDLAGLLAEFGRRNGWKTQTRIEDLTPPLIDLFISFLSVCPNGMLPIKKTKAAVLACQEAQSCNLTKLSSEDFSEHVGLVIRILASKFRALADDPPLCRQQQARVAQPDEQLFRFEMYLIVFSASWQIGLPDHANTFLKCSLSRHRWELNVLRK